MSDDANYLGQEEILGPLAVSPRTHALRWAAVTGVWAITIAVAIFATVMIVSVNVWDPLGQYPLQVVSGESPLATTTPMPSQPGSEAVTIRSNGPGLAVAAIKCVKPGEGEVTVEGEAFWVSDEPRGSTIAVGKSVAQRGPSCITYDYSNPIPEVVHRRLKELHEQGVDESRWHLAGEETPVTDEGERGVLRSWHTTTFIVKWTG